VHYSTEEIKNLENHFTSTSCIGSHPLQPLKTLTPAAKSLFQSAKCCYQLGVVLLLCIGHRIGAVLARLKRLLPKHMFQNSHKYFTTIDVTYETTNCWRRLELKRRLSSYQGLTKWSSAVK